MRRAFTYILIAALICGLFVAGYYFGDKYWVHRYDDLILRNASVYRVEPHLVWSIIYEETYFRATITGGADEVGLMQVTPTVAKEWAKATGLKEFEKKTSENVKKLLSDPEKNIQIGCWYLEQLNEKYREYPASTAMALTAYNAGPSRVEEWTKALDRSQLSETDFIEKIEIASTKKYVKSILTRFRQK